MTTRQQILSDAFDALKITSYQFDLEPDEVAGADRALDRMLAQWGSEGALLGHTPVEDGYPDVSADMTTPEWADEAISTNLALRLAPAYGKTVSPQTARQARAGYQLVLSRTRPIPSNGYPRVPLRGAGDRRWL